MIQRENPVVARIWFEITNMQRWDLHWEWMEENKEGEYLERDAVLKIIESHLKDGVKNDTTNTKQIQTD
jgi:hypothetical protein